MTFKPTFEDFETATKAIGDGTEVNTLLVHVYEGESNTPMEYTYDIYKREVEQNVSIPFFHGKEYTVYFFAYKAGKGGTAYKIADNGLKGGVTVTYPTESLGFDALEALDAFYAVREDVKLSANVETSVSLTRPFAQVNLTADKKQLLDAKATEVKFEVSVATSYDFKNGAVGEQLSDLTFSFVDDDGYFQNNDMISEKAVFLGTTYLFAPKVDEGDQVVPSIAAIVTLYDKAGNPLKGPSKVEIPLVSNNRTNLVFSDIDPAGPSWDDNEVKVPDAGADGWIHITRPEQLAAFLLNSTADGAKVCIDNDIDMSEIPEDVATNLAKASKSVKLLKLNGNNKTVSGLNLSAFFNEATNLSVYDLTLSGITVEGTSHVGVLVNTLKGESSFSNVNILNSSAATTNGAAGGMVGYIVRESATDRSKSMAIGFTDCQVISTSATGKESAGKFVGKFSGYDNGETLTFTDCSTSETSTSAENASPYVEGNEGAWLADTDFTSFNSWLGDEAYYRGVVTFGDIRFQPKWDGKTSVEPIFEDTSKKVAQIWSAFDLAYLQDKTLTSIRFKSDVDMCGVCEECMLGKGNSTIANDYLSTCSHCKPFRQIVTINNLYGENHTLYNLFIQGVHLVGKSNYGMGFIRYTSKGEYKDFTFDGAVIKCIDDINYRNDDQNGGNGYAGTLTSRVEGKMTISNVHARNGHVIGISKFGGLIGYVPGGIDATNCSVEYYTIENHKINVINSYSVSIEKKVSFITGKAECSENFYTEGEAGGFIGFINSSSTIKNCWTSNITMKCYGQTDRNTKIKCYTKKLLGSGWNHIMDMDYTIAGRHCNAFIGDIRTPNSETITISSCSTSNNTYVSGYDHHFYGENGYSSTNNGELVGCVYFVGKDVGFSSVSMHAGDYKGTVTIDGQSMPFIGG